MVPLARGGRRSGFHLTRPLSSRRKGRATDGDPAGVSWRGAMGFGLLGLAAYLTSLGLGRVPALAELYARTVSPWLSRPLSLFSGVLPFSLAEALLAVYGLYLAYRAQRAVRAVLRRRLGLLASLGGGMRRLLRDAGVAAAAFYLIWGFNYAREPYEARAGWDAFTEVQPEELVELAEQSVSAANQAYEQLHGGPDAGVPTRLPAELAAVERALGEGWARAAESLDLAEHTAQRYGSGKRPWVSWILARFGIAGIYAPWTAEANTLRGYPAVRAIHSMAHEQAHQRGFAIEAEANFMGFVVAASAPHPLPRYSAAVYAAVRFLGALRRVDPDAAQRIESARHPGIVRDLDEVRAFWERYRWAGSGLGAVVNDRYLRANRVPGGVASYARADRLLIEYARRSGGQLFPTPRTTVQETA